MKLWRGVLLGGVQWLSLSVRTVSSPSLFAATRLRRLLLSLLAVAGSCLAVPLGAQPLEPLSDVVQIATGSSHSCALSGSGGVKCWGHNGNGQLGDGSDSDTRRFSPVDVAGLNNGVSAISAGGNHTCALTSSGGVKCWGFNFYGQLGDGTTTSRLVPVDVVGLTSGVVAISASFQHTCALMSGGRARCWGQNASGQIGDGSTIRRVVPVDVHGLTSGVRAISAGGTHTCALTSANGIKCWGGNSNGQIGDGTTTQRLAPVDVSGLSSGALAISAGLNYTCALSTVGGVKCWGSNSDGQLGDGTTAQRVVPTNVSGLTSGIKAISTVMSTNTGSPHSCALTGAGGVKCWGSNINGKLGDGSLSTRLTAVAVSGLAGTVVQVSAADSHTCALIVDGSVMCWGSNVSGQLGSGSTSSRVTAVDVTGLDKDVAALGLGSNHSCAVTIARGVKCWGLNTAGQLGDGTTTTRRTPVDVSGLNTGVIAVSGGGQHTCALTIGGQVKCWGGAGLVGDGSATSRPTPVTVSGLTGVTSISAGSSHTCARTSTGGIKCWGANNDGQLGDGSTTQRLAPVDVVGLTSGALEVSAGGFGHTCALLAGGGVRCWGNNRFGQLGDGSTMSRATPVDVVGLTNGALAISSRGEGHSCAVTSPGGVRCWGRNVVGELGDGTRIDRATPVTVLGLTNAAAAITAGGLHTCVRTAATGMQCWGYNHEGQLGDGSTIGRPLPVDVGGLTQNVMAIDAGRHHSCALADSGGVKCWGNDQHGQIGVDGPDYAFPTLVLVDKAQARIEPVAENGDGASSDPVVDALGRFIVFDSAASNLVPADDNGRRDVFRQDRSRGLIEIVSLDDAGRQIMGDSIEPSVSADGELIVFVAPDAGVGLLAGESVKAAAVRGKTNHYAIFLRNMLTGTTRRIATALPGGTNTAPNIAPFAGGIAFTGLPSSPAEGILGQRNVFFVPLNRVGDEYLPGARSCPSCKSLSKISNGPSQDPVLSGNSEWMAFTSQASNVGGGGMTCPQAQSQVVLRNMLTGQRISVSSPSSSSQCGSLGAGKPSIDWSGTQVVFETDSALSTNDRNGLADVYLFDADSGALQRVSEDPRTGQDGLEASVKPRISGDGRMVTFQSSAPNLESSEPDNNETNDIFVRNLETETLRRVSRSARGDQGNAESDGAALSWDGASVAFSSQANNLLLHPLSGRANDTNDVQDVFLTANPLVAQSRSGTWWIPAESGWGVFTVDQGNALGVGWFTYDTDGEPTWFIGVAFKQQDGSYAGEMYRQTGVPMAAIRGLATETTEKFADITLRFIGSGGLQFDYAVVGGPSQAKNMTRFIFSGEDIVCRDSPFASRKAADNLSDLWWGGADTSGWGVFFNHASDLLVATWYTYDTDREALFLVAVTRRQPDGRFVGEIFRQATGTPFGAINGAPPSPAASVVGSLEVRVLDGETADFSYTVGSTVQSKRITRFAFGSELGVCEIAKP